MTVSFATTGQMIFEDVFSEMNTTPARTVVDDEELWRLRIENDEHREKVCSLQSNLCEAELRVRQLSEEVNRLQQEIETRRQGMLPVDNNELCHLRTKNDEYCQEIRRLKSDLREEGLRTEQVTEKFNRLQRENREKVQRLDSRLNEYVRLSEKLREELTASRDKLDQLDTDICHWVDCASKRNGGSRYCGPHLESYKLEMRRNNFPQIIVHENGSWTWRSPEAREDTCETKHGLRDETEQLPPD